MTNVLPPTIKKWVPFPPYTYADYKTIWNKLHGKTIHYWPGLGYRATDYELLTHAQFDDAVTQLLVLHATDAEGPDELESIMWQNFELRSALMLHERLNPWYDWPEQEDAT